MKKALDVIGGYKTELRGLVDVKVNGYRYIIFFNKKLKLLSREKA